MSPLKPRQNPAALRFANAGDVSRIAFPAAAGAGADKARRPQVRKARQSRLTAHGPSGTAEQRRPEMARGESNGAAAVREEQPRQERQPRRANRLAPQPGPALHQRPAERRPGNHRSDRQGAAGPQRRAHHIAHRAARPLRGLHADARTHGRLPQDRQRRRAPAPEAHSARQTPRSRRRIHHPHRRRGPHRR